MGLQNINCLLFSWRHLKHILVFSEPPEAHSWFSQDSKYWALSAHHKEMSWAKDQKPNLQELPGSSSIFFSPSLKITAASKLPSERSHLCHRIIRLIMKHHSNLTHKAVMWNRNHPKHPPVNQFVEGKRFKRFYAHSSAKHHHTSLSRSSSLRSQCQKVTEVYFNASNSSHFTYN